MPSSLSVLCPDFGLLTSVVLSGLSPDEDSCSDRGDCDKPGTSLPSFVLEGKTNFPEMFQTSHLLFYERFRAYQDYILGASFPRFASSIFSVCGEVAVSPGAPRCQFWAPGR